MKTDQCIRVDDRWLRAPVGPVTLLDWLREDIGITGPKEGCAVGHCGACTVLLDQAPVLACCVLAATLTGRQVETVATLTLDGVGERLLESFVEHDAVQCGFCTPGMLTASLAWLRCRSLTSVDEADLRSALAGNICRCTGYQQIVAAVLDIAASQGESM